MMQIASMKTLKTIEWPPEGEFAPYMLAYVSMAANDGQVLAHLCEQVEKTRALLGELDDAFVSTPCAEGEWTIKQIVAHVLDFERIFTYRALRIARNDVKTRLPGYDQEPDMQYIEANGRSMDELMEEYETVRKSTVMLFNSFPEAAFTRVGISSENPLSVRAAAHIIAGHELYHLRSIRENYLGAGKRG